MMEQRSPEQSNRREQLERYVLVSLATYPNIPRESALVKSFADPLHQVLFHHLLSFPSGSKISLVSLMRDARETIEVELRGIHRDGYPGDGYLLSSVVSGEAQGQAYLRQLLSYNNFEVYRKGLLDIIDKAEGKDDPASYLLVSQHSLQDRLLPASLSLSSLKELSLEGLRAEEVRLVEGSIGALTTGLGPLDDATGGYRPGELIFITGAPGTGKTTFVMWSLRVIAAQHGRVVFFSCEMTRRQLAERLARQEMGRSMRDVVSMDDIERTRGVLASTSGDLFPTPHIQGLEGVLIDFSPRVSYDYILSVARRQRDSGGLSAIVIDHLKHWYPGSGRGEESEYTRLSSAVGEAKEVAKLLDIPVIMLHHLNRSRADGDRPTFEMLRGTGAVENDADIVMTLWPQHGDNGMKSLGVDMWVIKARQYGGEDCIPLIFDPTFQSYDIRT